MTRAEAIAALARVDGWRTRQTAALLADMRARGACDPIPLTLHNWGRCGGDEPYRTLDREYRHREQIIWRTAERIGFAFARHLAEDRSFHPGGR